MAQFYAKWVLETLPDEIDDFHISCGVGDEQWDGYFVSDPRAKLTIKHKSNGYHVKLTAPTQGLENEKGWWLSPSCPHGREAVEFGIN